MRRIHARRRFRFLLILTLVVCITVFAENRIEALVPQVKSFAELKLGESFGEGSRLSIGSIEGGILHPIILNNISIVDGNGKVVAASVDIDSVKTNYRVWDVLFKARNESAILVDFSLKGRQARGCVRVQGDVNNSKASGVLDTVWFGKVLFSGSFRANSFDATFDSENGTVRASGFISGEGGLSVGLKAEHLKIGNFDIVCEARSNIYNVAGRLQGDFETKNLVVNYKPFPDIKVNFSASGGSLDIADARIGDIFRLTGTTLLNYPNNMDLTLFANNVNLSWLFGTLGINDASKILTGTMNGKFGFKGPVGKFKMAAGIEIRKGTMAELDFDALNATLKGDLPYLRIEDARIIRQSGYLTLAGEMDLSKIGKNSFFDNIRLTSDDNAINWDGLNSANLQGVREIRMKKRLSDAIDIDFKKFVADEKMGQGFTDKDEVGLEYKLHPKDSLKMTVGQSGEFLGLEHKDKF